MNRIFTHLMGAAALCALPAVCQQNVPVYRVTVVQRTVDAINYQYRAGPTRVDIRGTVLLTGAKGEATVDPQRGRTEIDAKFEGLVAPQRFGQEYLSYVLWAITPDGGSHSLGEIVPNSSNKASLHVTTDLQAFGLIVTAEPYAAVRQPSDVVVLQNEVRPDTVGQIQPINVKVELMPRGKYTWNVPSNESTEAANAPKVSMSRYEALLEIYEAQNAMGVARAAGAGQYAADTLAKAQEALTQAQRFEDSKGSEAQVVQFARDATEIAEDARAIAEKCKQDAQLNTARSQVAAAQQAQQQAEAAAQLAQQQAATAQAQAQAAQAQGEADRLARQVAEANAQAAREQSQTAVVVVTPAPAPTTGALPEQNAKDVRLRLMRQLNAALPTMDTPRGLEVTVDDSCFSGSQLRPGLTGAMAQLAAALESQPGLRVSVEGDTDSPATSEEATLRAAAVAGALVRAGVPAPEVSSQGLGNSRMLVSNDTERGRIENRRVEIVISGDPIGTVPSWDRTYQLTGRR
jgi:flagellar motor protein MotB